MCQQKCTIQIIANPRGFCFIKHTHRAVYWNLHGCLVYRYKQNIWGIIIIPKNQIKNLWCFFTVQLLIKRHKVKWCIRKRRRAFWKYTLLLISGMPSTCSFTWQIFRMAFWILQQCNDALGISHIHKTTTLAKRFGISRKPEVLNELFKSS